MAKDGTAAKNGKAKKNDAAADENNSFLLKDLEIGKKDKRGLFVEDILWAVRDFKIFKTARGVSLHFADDPDTAKAQRTQYLKLGQSLADVNHLLHILKTDFLMAAGRNQSKSSIPYYEREVARCIALILEGEESDTKAFEAITELANRLRRHIGNKRRIAYFTVCLLLAGALTGGSFLYLKYGLRVDLQLRYLAMAAGMGAIGALMAIAVGLRDLVINIESTSLLTFVYALQRILVGILGAIILYIALRAAIDLNITSYDNPEPSGEVNLYRLAFLSILAGFSERLVPDFLDREAKVTDAKSTPS